MATTKSGLKTAQAIYNNLSPESRKIVPEPTEDNVKDFTTALMTYDAVYDEFVHIIQKISFSFIKAARSKNPLSLVNRGTVPLGTTIEEVYSDLLEAYDYSPCDESSFDEMFGTSPAKVYSIYHSQNFHKVVKRSIKDKSLRRVSTTWDDVGKLSSELMAVVYETMKDYELQETEDMLSFAHNAGHCYPVLVNDAVTEVGGLLTVDADDMKANVTIQKATAHRLNVRASRKYNFMGVANMTELTDLLYITTPEILAAQDVEVLASAFNMSKTEFLGRVIEVDGFGGAENDGVVGYLIDRAWFQIYDEDTELTSVYNTVTRSWNYRYYLDAVYSYSLFHNAIELVTAKKGIEGVTITAGQTCHKCGDVQVAYTIENDGAPGGWSAKCDWSIAGNTSKRTYISPFGLLHVGNDETASTIAVTAKSVQDPSKTSTVNVTVLA